MSKIQEVKDLANQLEGISEWLYASEKGDMSKMMSDAAHHLNSYSEAICCAGIICDGGEDCTSDHK